jgi:tetratricopeptide (TPR) repeat protein
MAYKALAQKQFPLAVSYSKDAVANKENTALAHYYMGLAYEGLNNAPQAVQAYTTSLSQDALRPETHYALGVLELKRKNSSIAMKHLNRFVELTQAQAPEKKADLQPQIDFAQRVLLQASATKP